MGFKRTSEGRVFFQGADNNDSEQQGAQNRSNGISGPVNSPSGISSANMQTQIVTLLKTLNERLKATQADRNKMAKELEAYRSLLEGLDQKSQRSERAYMELERKLSSSPQGAANNKAELIAREALKELQETRKLLLELEDKAERADRGVSAMKSEMLEARKLSNQLIGKQTSLEKFALEQAERLADSSTTFSALVTRLKDTEQKQQDLGEKVELATAEQARLMRKLDKAVEDRARFVRKIERIEEAVIQTREHLNAKAMVLLTDQGKGGMGLGLDDADELQAQLSALQAQTGNLGAQPQTANLYAAELPWWRKPYRMQAAGLGVVVVVALLGGWAISELQKPSLPDFNVITAEKTSAEATPEAEQTQAPRDAKPLDMAAMDWSVDTEAAQTETQTPEQGTEAAPKTSEELAPAPLTHDDIGALDLSKPEDVERLLDADSQTAGQALNAIEPSTPSPVDTKAADDVKQAQVEIAKEKIKIDPANLKSPEGLIKADSSLPEVVKQIESKGFEGVPEAQHDLAAIYTAGHGGVKQDYKRAAFWFEQAADRGIANAAYNLGVLHHQGLGTIADLEKALTWYRKAAAMGHPEAQYNLGIAYIEGIGVGYDPVKATAYFKNAADQDIMEAAYNLGLIYENGLLGNAKPDEALVWYKTAADQGSPEARQALEQLAKSLNIKLEDVNRLAESMKVIKKSDASPLDAPTRVASKAPASRSQPQAPQEEVVAAVVPSKQAITAQVQEYLIRLGLYPGPSDGVMGPLTGDSIRSYQKMHGLNPDGLATQGLLSHMLASASTSDEGPDEQGSREY
jgi:localization factor PodJL